MSTCMIMLLVIHLGRFLGRKTKTATRLGLGDRDWFNAFLLYLREHFH
jgi:hypothetical protein